MTTVGQTWRRRKRERPEEILTAAHIEFCENPFGTITMSQIAKRAGISKGTIYLYFSSKDELFSAIVGEVWHQTSVRHVAQRFGELIVHKSMIMTSAISTHPCTTTPHTASTPP